MPTMDAVMTTQDVADRFNELAQTGKWDQIQSELFADDATSTESDSMPGEKVVKGREGIKQKAVKFQEMTEEMHGGYSNKPQVAGNHFAVVMGMDVTMKGQGRMKMDEVAVYKVKDGKIVSEQFFY